MKFINYNQAFFEETILKEYTSNDIDENEKHYIKKAIKVWAEGIKIKLNDYLQSGSYKTRKNISGGSLDKDIFERYFGKLYKEGKCKRRISINTVKRDGKFIAVHNIIYKFNDFNNLPQFGYNSLYAIKFFEQILNPNTTYFQVNYYRLFFTSISFKYNLRYNDITISFSYKVQRFNLDNKEWIDSY